SRWQPFRGVQVPSELRRGVVGAAPMHLHVRRIWLRDWPILAASPMYELPEVGPQTWVAQKVDHDARVACVRRFEDYRDLPVFVSQLIFRQPPPTEYRRRLRSIQPFEEARMLRLVTAFDPTNPDARVFAGRRLRRHSTSVPQTSYQLSAISYQLSQLSGPTAGG